MSGAVIFSTEIKKKYIEANQLVGTSFPCRCLLEADLFG